MKERLILLAFIGSLFIGCKAKKRTTHTKRNKPVRVVQNKKVTTIEDDGLYTLPLDNGDFIHYEIGSVVEYVQTFAEIAQFEMKAYGIPASITLAQGLLESGLGSSELTRKTNNHFGIKCHKGWDGDFDYHDDDEVGECFRKYNHPMYSYRDHSLFLKNRSRYASLFDLRKDDYKKWAHGLKKAGYATDKRYPHKLIGLIEQHQLYKYDKVVLSSDTRQNINKDAEKEVVTPLIISQYVVEKGDTLYSISRKFAVSLDNIKKWNYLQSNAIKVGQQLIIKTAN